MTKKNFAVFIYFFTFCFLFSCGDSPIHIDASRDESGEEGRLFSPEEDTLTNTNPLIKGVTEGKPIESLQEHISYLLDPNLLGNTALGEAIRFRSEEDALLLLSNLQCQHLHHTNHERESFVYLASRRGYSILISHIAEMCYKSQEEWLDGKDYEFSTLDPETKKGDKALHIAANALVAERLVYEYEERGVEATPLSPWNFYYHKNQEGQTFLHKAAADSRVGIIKWALKRECDKSSSESDRGIWEEIIHFGKALWKKAQTNTWNITNLITQQDNNDNTALHLAASSLNKEAIHALANCPWIDLSLKNLDGDIPLQSFLKALDFSTGTHEEALEPLKRLIHSETAHIGWWRQPANLVNHQNQDGNSSLHLAAKLSDPSLYDYLKQFGNTALKNKQENTPEQIFESTKQKLPKSK